MLKSLRGFAFKNKKKEKQEHMHKRVTTEDEIGRKKRRMVVNVLLSMTLNEEVETELLWEVSKGFDLPLVIGEQFICKLKNTKFQSASYNDCLQFILTTLYEEGHPFANNIYETLMDKLDDDGKCFLAYHALECKTRNYHFHEYKNCFVGKEAVTWMIDNNLCDTRAQAVELGQRWTTKKYIRHVVDDQKAFDDGNFYYLFKATPKLKQLHSGHNNGNDNDPLPTNTDWNMSNEPRLKTIV